MDEIQPLLISADAEGKHWKKMITSELSISNLVDAFRSERTVGLAGIVLRAGKAYSSIDLEDLFIPNKLFTCPRDISSANEFRWKYELNLKSH